MAESCIHVSGWVRTSPQTNSVWVLMVTVGHALSGRGYSVVSVGHCSLLLFDVKACVLSGWLRVFLIQSRIFVEPFWYLFTAFSYPYLPASRNNYVKRIFVKFKKSIWNNYVKRFFLLSLRNWVHPNSGSLSCFAFGRKHTLKCPCMYSTMEIFAS